MPQQNEAARLMDATLAALKDDGSWDADTRNWDGVDPANPDAPPVVGTWDDAELAGNSGTSAQTDDRKSTTTENT